VRDKLDYTLFGRSIYRSESRRCREPKEGSSRFHPVLSNVLYKRPIKLVDGGSQKRSFTYIDDAVEPSDDPRESGWHRQPAYFQHRQPGQLHLDPRSGAAHHQDCAGVPVLRDNARATEIIDISAGEYYGKYYQDIQVRYLTSKPPARPRWRQPPTWIRNPAHHRVLREAGRLRHARARSRRASSHLSARSMDLRPGQGCAAGSAGGRGSSSRPLVRDSAGARARSDEAVTRRSARDAGERTGSRRVSTT